jgi:hypothetical protein
VVGWLAKTTAAPPVLLQFPTQSAQRA